MMIYIATAIDETVDAVAAAVIIRGVFSSPSRPPPKKFEEILLVIFEFPSVQNILHSTIFSLLYVYFNCSLPTA